MEKLGLLPTLQRAKQFFVGLIISALCGLIYFSLIVLLSGSKVKINDQFHFIDLFKSIWWTAKSVLFEEFLFRGALLYLVIQLLGSRKALVLSAVVFGIYHWFSYNVFGDFLQMLVIFLLTAAGGLAFSYSFIKTNSMYMQTGLHFAWNFVSIIVFSTGPLGEQLLVISSEQTLGTGLSLLLLLFQIILLPIATILYLKKGLRLGAMSSKSY